MVETACGFEVTLAAFIKGSLCFFCTSYRQDPTWVEASFYDSSFLATKAISETLKKNNTSIKDVRNNIKEYLSFLNEPKDAINGLTGPIYFDRFQKRTPQRG